MTSFDSDALKSTMDLSDQFYDTVSDIKPEPTVILEELNPSEFNGELYTLTDINNIMAVNVNEMQNELQTISNSQIEQLLGFTNVGDMIKNEPLDEQAVPVASEYTSVESPTNSGLPMTLPDLPVTITEASEPDSSGRRRRSSSTTPYGRIKDLDKDSDEYRQKRERNNVAVRKSRDKAKKKQQDTEKRMKDIVKENEQLKKKCEMLGKELSVLKGLFKNLGYVPSELERFIAQSSK